MSSCRGGRCDFLMAQIAATLPDYLTFALEIAPDYRVLAYATFLSIAATLASGLVPALRVSSPNLTSALKDEGSPFGGLLRKSRLRDLMIGVQVAICLVLLIAAGLIGSHLSACAKCRPRVQLSQRSDACWFLLPQQLQTRPSLRPIEHNWRRRLAGLPEIQAVSAASRVPLGGGLRTIAVSTNGTPLSDPGARSSFFNLVTPSYFATMGIPIVRGRNFTAQEARHTDNFDGSPVIVSEATARLFWPGQDPIGKRFAFGPGRDSIRFSGEGYPHSDIEYRDWRGQGCAKRQSEERGRDVSLLSGDPWTRRHDHFAGAGR